MPAGPTRSEGSRHATAGTRRSGAARRHRATVSPTAPTAYGTMRRPRPPAHLNAPLVGMGLCPRRSPWRTTKQLPGRAPVITPGASPRPSFLRPEDRGSTLPINPSAPLTRSAADPRGTSCPSFVPVALAHDRLAIPLPPSRPWLKGAAGPPPCPDPPFAEHLPRS